LGLHVFQRVSDTDRVRLVDNPLAQLLEHPNPATTRYRLIETLMQDLGIYFNAYWLKVRSDPMTIVRLPPEQMTVLGVLLPTGFVWTTTQGAQTTFAPSEIVHFSGYGDGVKGLSPLETLRRTLAEDAASGQYRQQMWLNAARIEGVIERPKDAKAWSPTQKQQWREQWQATYASGGARPGSVAVLEDGMTFKPISYSARDSEYSAARKLSKTECAAAYHIPPPMVGDLEHATFSNIVEQHKNLYQDTLGPWLEMIQSEIERQLLREFATAADHLYVEFNINDKLKGSFEQQAGALHTLIGRPMMTPNEGRARLNLPRITDDPTADQLAAQQGGPSDASVGTAPPEPVDTSTSMMKKPDLKLVKSDAHDLTRMIAAHQARQADRLQRLPVSARAAAFRADVDRWTAELAADLGALTGADETAWAAKVTADTLDVLEADARLAAVTERRVDHA
jgi:HK97 family phage portal protein